MKAILQFRIVYENEKYCPEQLFISLFGKKKWRKIYSYASSCGGEILWTAFSFDYFPEALKWTREYWNRQQILNGERPPSDVAAYVPDIIHSVSKEEE